MEQCRVCGLDATARYFPEIGKEIRGSAFDEKDLRDLKSSLREGVDGYMVSEDEGTDAETGEARMSSMPFDGSYRMVV